MEVLSYSSPLKHGNTDAFVHLANRTDLDEVEERREMQRERGGDDSGDATLLGEVEVEPGAEDEESAETED